MKKTSKRSMAIIMSLALMVTLLSGCFGGIAEVTVNKDGSGNVVAKFGVTEDGLKAYSEYMGMPYDSSSIDGQDSFIYNGVTYYGPTMTNSFSKPEDLSFKFEETSTGDYGSISSTQTFDFGDVKLTQIDGGYNLSINYTPDTAEPSPEEQAMMDEIMKYKDTMAQILVFNMPGKVTQTKGDGTGVTISDSKLTIDYMEYMGASNIDIAFNISVDGLTATTNPPVATDTQPVVSRFKDVDGTAWYVKAVETMAEQGIVNGKGNGVFAPNDSITIAEFAQMVARSAGFGVGSDENGWWAGRAVKSCVAAGYIDDRGTGSASYTVPITREEAIAGLQRASVKYTNQTANTSLSDIPDGKDITPKYQADIVDAYRFGITTGVDSAGTFSPKRNLTRAEVCQMFYNLPTVHFVPDGESWNNLSSDKIVYTLSPGDKTLVLLANIPKDKSMSDIVWVSNNPGIAEVNQDGVITAISEGTTTIMISMGNIVKECSATVTANYTNPNLEFLPN